jgi:hypothetical protein
MTPYEQTDAMLSEQVKPKDDGLFSLPEVDGYKYDPMALPVGSMPEDDQVIGYDELGFKIRKNISGTTYTIQPVVQKDISLSERAGNVVENVGSAYKAVKEDPLGTATGLAKGVAQGIAKTVGAFSDPNATTQDAMNVAGMMAGASAPRLLDGYDPNVTRIFGGPRAKKFPNEKEGEAILLDMAGEDPQKIYEQTGIQYLPQRGDSPRPVFNIDPAGASVKDFDTLKQTVPSLSAAQKASGESGKVALGLSDVVDFPEIYENYPQLKDFEITFDPDIKKGNGSFDVREKQLNLSMASLEDTTPDKILDVVLHELQHGVQAVEGTSGGAAASWFLDRQLGFNPRTGNWQKIGPWRTNAGDMSQDVDNLNKLDQAAKDAMEAYTTGRDGNLPTEEVEDLYGKAVSAMDTFVADKERLERLAYMKYEENPGELEARAAQLWAKLTPEERLKTKPSDVYDQASMGYSTYARIGEEPFYGENDMPTARLPANKEEELRKKLNTDAQMLEMQPENQTAASWLFGGAKPTVAKPKMFATTGEGKLELNPESLMEFYSPTVEAIKSVEFPAKGYKGSELVKFLQTKAQGVRRAELDAMDLGVDPMKRYTKEEAVALAENKAYKVTAKEVDDPANASTQRQQVKDREVSSTTLIVDAIPNSPDSPAFYPNMDRTHYNDETIAHSRVSVRENNEGEQYLLVEEIQSDLVQKGAAKPRGPVSRDTAYSELLENMPMSKEDKAFFKKNKEALTEYFTIGSEDTRISQAKRDGLPVSADEEAKLEARTAKLRETFDINEMGRKFGNADYKPNDFLDKITKYSYESPPIAEKRMRAIGKSPLTEDSDAVRLALQVAMSKASQEGVSSIVIPNLQRIVTSGRARLGSKEYDSFMGKSSGFTKTYKDGVQNFISQLKEEFGDGIQIKTIDLPYFSDKGYANGVEQTLDNTAIQIDFSGVKDANFRVGRFAEGGMVEDKQMDELMQEGGMADDGMSQEPVTGNDIPPGALASEVRDDVDAKLSEGEYVVPADVVRYFGVSFFEGLRTKAKQGLSDMEANGRIGGTPVDAQGVPAEDSMDELSPEEEQMLQQALGTSGMAVGGDVAGFDRTKFTLTPTAPTGLGASSNVETRQYFNPSTGEKQAVQFMDGVALGAIPVGFVPWTQTLEDTYNAAKSQPSRSSSSSSSSEDNTRTPTGGNKDNSSGAAFNYSKWADENYDAINSNPYEFGMKALDDTSGQGLSKGLGLAGLATGLMPLAMLGAGLGASNKMQNIAEANAALKVMDSKGLQDTPEYKSLTNKVTAYISDLPMAQQTLVTNHLAATGGNYEKALAAKSAPKAPTTMTPAPSQGTPVQKKNSTTSQPAPVPTSAAKATSLPTPTVSQRSPSGSESVAESAARAKANAATGASKVVSTPAGSQRVSIPTTAPAKTTTKVVSTPAGNKTVTTPTAKVSQAARAGFTDGGLVAKPKKTTPKSKGLGGKQ